MLISTNYVFYRHVAFPSSMRRERVVESIFKEIVQFDLCILCSLGALCIFVARNACTFYVCYFKFIYVLDFYA